MFPATGRSILSTLIFPDAGFLASPAAQSSSSFPLLSVTLAPLLLSSFAAARATAFRQHQHRRRNRQHSSSAAESAKSRPRFRLIIIAAEVLFRCRCSCRFVSDLCVSVLARDLKRAPHDGTTSATGSPVPSEGGGLAMTLGEGEMGGQTTDLSPEGCSADRRSSDGDSRAQQRSRTDRQTAAPLAGRTPGKKPSLCAAVPVAAPAVRPPVPRLAPGRSARRPRSATKTRRGRRPPFRVSCP